MKKVVYFILFFPIVYFGQSSTFEKQKNTHDVNKKEKNITTNFIEYSFSKPTIIAYQNRATERINEFYNYLILLQNTNDTNLQKQLKENIKLLFVHDQLSFLNVFDHQNKKYTIDEILEQIILKKVIFKQPIFTKKVVTNSNDFGLEYLIEIQVNNEIRFFNLTQKVHLFPAEKQFGAHTKTVWELKLGEF